jgi:aspartate racemase
MKMLGMVGGIGPESTIDYYRLVVATYRERVPDGSYPPLIINSINLSRMISLITANDLGGVIEYLLPEFQRLAKAGADFGLLAANTPHLVFDELRARSPLPLLSIVEATADAAAALGHRRLGLFGTRFTMEAGFYAAAFSQKGITLLVPNEAERAFIHDRYMTELVNGIFLPETRARLLAIAKRMREQESIDGLILGGTELPLLMRDAADCPVPLLDTAQIHVRAAVDMMLA